MFSYNYTNIYNNELAVVGNYPEHTWNENCYLPDQVQLKNQMTAQSYYNNYQGGSCDTGDENRSSTDTPTSINTINIPKTSNELLIQCSQQQNEPVVHPNSSGRSNFTNSRLKKPHARIFVKPAVGGNYKTIIKRIKRRRTSFTTEQLAVLEQYFRKWPYITREQRQVLAEKLQLNVKSVKVWFQNRRSKGKREVDEKTLNGTVYPDSSNDNSYSKLDHVQSEIIKMTDVNGFVTLDDRVMEDLVDVIDNFLGNENQVILETKEYQDSPLLYEPVSPASISDDSSENDTFSTWSPSEPNESFQRLFDLQNMLCL